MKKVVLLITLSLLIAAWGPCSTPLVRGPVNPIAELDLSKDYKLVYWDLELPAILGTSGYREQTEALLEEFTRLHPNIKVEVEWLAWGEGQDRLSKALANGTPPDLFADWHGISDYNHLLQLPAQLWLKRELEPAARRALSREGEVLSWPRWIWPYGLIARDKDLGLSPEQLESLLWQRWNWEEFSAWMEERGLRLEVNDFEAQFSGSVLLAATGNNFAQGWRGPETFQVFEWFSQLQKDGLLRADGEYQRLAGGKVMLAGTEPALLVWLKYNFPDQTRLLPIPGFYPDATWYPVMVTSLAQFRQARYKGDDHSLAAAMLAKFLSEGQAVNLSASLLATPGYADLDWDSSALDRAYFSFLSDASLYGAPLYSSSLDGRRRGQKYRDDFSKVVKDFWSGKTSHEELARWLNEYR